MRNDRHWRVPPLASLAERDGELQDRLHESDPADRHGDDAARLDDPAGLEGGGVPPVRRDDRERPYAVYSVGDEYGDWGFVLIQRMERHGLVGLQQHPLFRGLGRPGLARVGWSDRQRQWVRYY